MYYYIQILLHLVHRVQAVEVRPKDTKKNLESKYIVIIDTISEQFCYESVFKTAFKKLAFREFIMKSFVEFAECVTNGILLAEVKLSIAKYEKKLKKFRSMLVFVTFFLYFVVTMGS